MPNRSRQKGDRLERKIVHLLHEAGIPAERVPLSGAVGGTFSGDLSIADTWRAEVKGRAHGEGFLQLERWLGTQDMLVLARDRALPMVMLSWTTFLTLLQQRKETV